MTYRRLIVGLLAAIAALLWFAWMANEVLAGATLQFDESIRRLVHQHASPTLTTVMRGVSFVGSPSMLLTIGIIVVVRYWRTGRPRTAILFVLTVAGAELLDQLLKLLFHRTRPVAFFGLAEPVGYSFPSGHSLVSCCFFGVLAAFAAARTQHAFRRWLLYASAALLVALIGFSRIYLGVHYPSDVLAGYAAAIVWVFSIASARRALRRLQSSYGTRARIS